MINRTLNWYTIFFKKIKGDFSYIQAMYEELLDNRPSITGYSFIKKIAPGETFTYFIVKTDPESNFLFRKDCPYEGE